MANKTEMKRRAAKMWATNLKALRAIAKANGLKVIKADTTTKSGGIGFRIGCELGLGLDRRAGYVIAGENGYISNRPHGDNYHSMGLIFGELRAFQPDKQDGIGYGSDKEWAQWEAKGEVLFGAVLFGEGGVPWADNILNTPKEISKMLERIGAKKPLGVK
jgi:hypothetical protein